MGRKKSEESQENQEEVVGHGPVLGMPIVALNLDPELGLVGVAGIYTGSVDVYPKIEVEGDLVDDTEADFATVHHCTLFPMDSAPLPVSDVTFCQSHDDAVSFLESPLGVDETPAVQGRTDRVGFVAVYPASTQE